MEYFFIIPLLIIVCVYVCYPFFFGNKPSDLYIEDNEQLFSNGKDSSLKHLEDEKDNIYRGIKEIEFDFGLGKLSDEDYKELRQQYIYQASQIVKKIEGISGQTSVARSNDSIENEILSARKAPSNIYDDIEEEIKRARGKK